jgi:hypothetical protein
MLQQQLPRCLQLECNNTTRQRDLPRPRVCAWHLPHAHIATFIGVYGGTCLAPHNAVIAATADTSATHEHRGRKQTLNPEECKRISRKYRKWQTSNYSSIQNRIAYMNLWTVKISFLYFTLKHTVAGLTHTINQQQQRQKKKKSWKVSIHFSTQTNLIYNNWNKYKELIIKSDIWIK